MATYTSTSGKYTTTLTVTQGTQDIANNTSTVNWTLTLVSDGGSIWHNDKTCPWNVKLNGTTVDSGTFSYNLSGGTTTILNKSGSISVTHNNDGTKSIPVSAYVDMDNTPYVYPMSISDTFTLTTIPRASSVSVSNATLTASGTLSFTITSKANYYHKAWWNVNGGTDTEVTLDSNGQINTTSKSFTIAHSLIYAKLPNVSGTLNIKVATYSNSGRTTQVGSTQTANCTVTIDTTSVKPAAPTLGNITINATSLANYAVAGYSSLKVSCTPQLTSGATSITTYFSVNSGATLTAYSTTSTSAVNIVTNTLPGSSKQYSVTISAYSVDNRGGTSATSSKTYSTVYGYSKPTANLVAYRTATSGGDQDNAGGYVKITFSNSLGGLTNTSGALISSNPNTLNTTNTKVTWSGGASGSATSSPVNFALSTSSSVNITYTVQDSLTSTVANASVGSAAYPLDLYDSGTGTVGVGFGAVAEGGYVKLGADLHVLGNWYTAYKGSVSNLNQIAEGVVTYNPSTSNRPNDYGVCYTLGYDGRTTSSSWFSQVAFGTNGKLYFRNSINSLGATWSAWYEFYGAFNLQPTVANATRATNATYVDWTNEEQTSSINQYFIPFGLGYSTNTSNRGLLANDGLSYYSRQGTTSARGYARLNLGNNISSGTAGNKWGQINFWRDGKYTQLVGASASSTTYNTVVLPTKNPESAYLKAEKNLYTEHILGGNSQLIDMSGWTRIRVYAMTWGVQHVFEIDLEDAGKAQSGHGLTDANWPWQGGSTVPHRDGAGTTGGHLTYYSVSCKVGSDKKSLWVTSIGYQNIQSSFNGYVQQLNNSEYYVYRVVGISD